MAAYPMFRVFVSLSSGKVWDDTFDIPTLREFLPRAEWEGCNVVVTDMVPNSVIDNAPESRGFHDPDDADAGGCSWITPQGSF